MQIQAKDFFYNDLSVVLSEAKNLALTTIAGSVATWSTDPRGLLIGLVAQKAFLKSSFAAMRQLPAENLKGKGAIAGAIALLGSSLFVGREVAKWTGFETSVTAMLAGYLLKTAVTQILFTPKDNLFDNAKVVNVTLENYEEEVLNSKVPVVVDAYGVWCPPCTQFAPIFSKISHALDGPVKFAKINIADESDLASKLNIDSIPTILFYKDGVIVERRVGALDKQSLLDKIKEVFKIK